MEYVLAADISGTHTRIFVFDTENFKITTLKEYATHDIDDFTSLIHDYLEERDISIGSMVFACAGKVHEEKVSLANSSLSIDAHVLQKEFGIDVTLINDFEVIACGVEQVDEKKLCEVLPSLVKPHKQLFIGAGTGLGVGVYNRDTLKYENLEAGHFLGQEVLIEYLEAKNIIEFAQNYYGEKKVEIEDVLSGRGLEMINNYFTGENLRAEDIVNKKTINEFFKIYAHTINYFAKIYGCSFVYVAGGIVGRRYPEMNEHNFTQYINHHLGVSLILDYDVSLYGLVEFYKHLIKN